MPPQLLPRRKTEVPNIQVDVARKIQGDPLLDIMQQQEERKAMLREQMLIQQRLASQSKKSKNLPSKDSRLEKKQRHKKIKRKKSESSSDSSDLDEKLADKLKKLKNKDEERSLDSQIALKLKHLKKRVSSSSSSSSSSSTSTESEEEKSSNKKILSRGKVKNAYGSNDKRQLAHQHSRHRSYEESSRPQHKKVFSPSRERKRRSRERRSRSQERRRSRSKEKRSRSREERTHGSRDERSNYNSEKERRRIGVTTYTNQATGNQQRASMASFPRKRHGTRLNEEELEKRRREMMQEAVVRDQERRTQVEKYRKEAEVEATQLSINRPKEAAFVK